MTYVIDGLAHVRVGEIGYLSPMKAGAVQRRVLTALMRNVCALALIALSVDAAAGDQSAAKNWQAMARLDLDAAYQLLQNNHPGASAELGDAQFTTALAAAHAAALKRASAISNYEGYTATLGEFASSMGDGHIWSHPLFLPGTLEWAGLIAAKRGADWVVANDNATTVGTELGGARILSCDGVPVETLAQDVLHFQTNVDVAAMQSISAGWLLLDAGNPFLRRPRVCVFDQDGKPASVTLRWSSIRRDELRSRYWKHPYGAAGFELRASGAGYWIAIQELTPAAQPVIDAVKVQNTAIRAAPYLVVDLRGNGGGDDDYGRTLAEQIYGRDFVTAVIGPRDYESGGCPAVFRASSDNIAAMSAAATEFQQAGDAAGFTEYTTAVTSMKAAAALGRHLAGNLTCPAKSKSKPEALHSLPHGKIYVLTDAACFSSCIQVVGFFRQLGAIQVGEVTNADTHYSEVREIVLPSGLSTFSTLQAMMPDAPRQIGPYDPKYQFNGDIADTAALEKWIADLNASSTE
jgi:hypothetical protein